MTTIAHDHRPATPIPRRGCAARSTRTCGLRARAGASPQTRALGGARERDGKTQETSRSGIAMDADIKIRNSHGCRHQDPE
eukprot:scaffold1453_cov112-Isochrysis_galbana.AAC.4